VSADGCCSTQEAAQSFVGCERADVAQTLASGGQEQHQRLDLLDPRVPATSLSYPDVLLDGPVGAERSHRLEHQRQACPRRRLPELLGHLDDVGENRPIGRSPR
jgi:hypothetical protein